MGRLFARQAGQEQRDELLSAYLDDQLDAGERARLEEQLAADPALRAEMEALRHTVMLVRGLPTIPIPRNFILPRTVARPRPAPAARPRRALRARPQGRAWAAPLLTAATALASLLFVVVLAGDLLLSGVGGLAYAPAAEKAAPPQLALEPSPDGQEVEAGEAVSDATLPVEVPPPAAEAPVEAPPDAAGGGEELEAEGTTPADVTPTTTPLAMPTEAPPKAAPEVATEEENHEMVTPVAEATVSAASVGRDEGEVALTPPAVEKLAAEEELAAAPATATAAPVAVVGFAELAPGEVEEEGEWDTSGDERADGPALAWVTPWRVLEITLGLTVLGLALATVWAWRARRR